MLKKEKKKETERLYSRMLPNDSFYDVTVYDGPLTTKRDYYRN